MLLSWTESVFDPSLRKKNSALKIRKWTLRTDFDIIQAQNIVDFMEIEV